MKKVKILYRVCTIFFAVSILSLIIGCADSNNGLQETDFSDSTINTEAETFKVHKVNPDDKVYAEAYLKSIPSKDFNGATFFITAPSTMLFNSDGTQYLSKDVAERNKKVEEKLNIKINTSEKDADTMLEDAISSIAAGMYYSDIMMVPLNDIGTFSANNVLMNLRSLPSFDISMPYFNQQSVKALSAGFYTYGVAGEANPLLSDLPVLYFNTELINSYNGQSLYDLAKNGGFTWDVFFECIAMIEENTDESIMSAGAGSISERLPDIVHASTGGSIVSSGALVSPKVAFTPDSLSGAVSYTNKLYRTRGIFDSDGALESFKNGKLAFIFENISNAETLQSKGINWGILPIPKADLEADYKSLVSKTAPIFTVTSNTTNGELVSLTLSSLCAASYGYMTERYVDYVHVNSMRNSESCDILDLLSDSAVFDLSLAFGETSDAIADGTYNFIRRASQSGDAQSDYDAYVYEANVAMEKVFPLSH